MKALINSKIIMTLLFLPFMEPFGIEEMASSLGGSWRYIHLAFVALRIVSYSAILLMSLYQMKKPSTIFVIMLFHQLIIIGSTMIHGGFSISRLELSIESIGIVLLLSYYTDFGNPKRMVLVIENILSIIIVCNLISIIIFPDGMYRNIRNWSQNWLLGYRNLHIQFFLPYIGIAALRSSISKKKNIKLPVMIVLIVLSAFLVNSVTTIISIIIIATLVILFTRRELPSWINLTSTYIASVIISILLVAVGIQYRFSGLLTNVLGKDVTFSTRTLIWSQGLMMFWKRPFFGNGIVSIESGNIYNLTTVNQMHNMFLDLLVVGGISLAILFFATILITNKHVMNCRIISLRNIFIFVFMAYSVVFLTEARRNIALLNMFLFIAYYLPYLTDKLKSNELDFRVVKLKWRNHR